MKKYYSIFFWGEIDRLNALLQEGIIICPNKGVLPNQYFDRVRIYDRFYELIDKYYDIMFTWKLYTNCECFFETELKDIKESEYCVLKYIGGAGYPECKVHRYPTLDKSKACELCGYPYEQIGSYRLERPSKRKISSFIAHQREPVFVRRDVYDAIFAPLGIGYIPTLTMGKKIIENVVQLDIPIIDEKLDMPYCAKQICKKCGFEYYSEEYYFTNRYYYFPLHNNPLPHIYYSNEFFFENNRNIFISSELALKLIKEKVLKPDHFRPCKRNLREWSKDHPEFLVRTRPFKDDSLFSKEDVLRWVQDTNKAWDEWIHNGRPK